ncbi:MAG: MarR family transcriptional regulator [Paracoccus sp. (in: a-proteobacteria)]|nr:MarR family transcriptional regulator [Paracoccus sp. (in: a-proteobacteria)]
MNLDRKYLALMGAAAPEQADELRICFELLSLASAIDRDCARRLAPHQLSESRFLLLSLLRSDPDGLAPHLLAARAGVTRATMTGLLDGMAKDGLLDRSHDSADRRRIIIRLTPEGRGLADQLCDEHQGWIASLAGGLSTADRTALRQLLGRIRQNLGADAQTIPPQKDDGNDALSC